MVVNLSVGEERRLNKRIECFRPDTDVGGSMDDDEEYEYEKALSEVRCPDPCQVSDAGVEIYRCEHFGQCPLTAGMDGD